MLAKLGSFKSLRAIAAEINNQISARTVRCLQCDIKLPERTAHYAPLLREKNLQKGKPFAQNHKSWCESEEDLENWLRKENIQNKTELKKFKKCGTTRQLKLAVKAVIGPLPDDFLRLTTHSDRMASIDAQTAMALYRQTLPQLAANMSLRVCKGSSIAVAYQQTVPEIPGRVVAVKLKHNARLSVLLCCGMLESRKRASLKL
ncbi:hypothetical protein EVAR_69881_1 [Eumeta japonica]|uniref:Uncharacterized protein n=1 Tax=Eumeta variegata TaxID=151549 RepID=A0A4C1SJ52_EUMVA|nr:hypothetical protein EVAR_69881_1 [Eumeta japonica]